MQPGFDESWPDDGRPSKIEVNRLLDEVARKRRVRLLMWSVGFLAIGVGIAECSKGLGWW